MTHFKDHFSRQAADYTRYRPHYPPALFAYLATLPAEHDLAWDCATGNGQAARGLTSFFGRIVATDASPQQIANASPHPQISYAIASAEQTQLEAGAVDLITVAQALHWFDRDKFYAEVRRVLKPEGAIAVWSYSMLRIEPTIDGLLDYFYTDIVGPFWPFERRWVEEGYRSLPFPFAELAPPTFSMESRWNLNQLLGYLSTWSATQAYKAKYNTDPLAKISIALEEAWGTPHNTRPVEWPLALRVGRPGSLL